MWSVIIAGACVLYIVWVIAVYPVILSRLASRRPSTMLWNNYEPSITAIIPAHNGGAHLAAKLDSVLGSNWNPEKLHVLVLSDGSTDDTDSIAESYAASGRVQLVRLPRGGKSAALNAGLARAQGEILLLTDVRQRLAPDCIRKLIDRLRDPDVAVVSGRLVILPGRNAEETNVGLYWKYESWIRWHLSRHDSLLGASGAIYAIRRELARPLPPDCLLDDVWLPVQTLLAGYRIVCEEDAVVWDQPTALRTEFRRKVRTQAGVYQLLYQEPRLLGRANRLRWHFVSHKVGRLFLPHVLLILLAASFALPGLLRLCVLPLQLGFYGLAGLDYFVRDGAWMKRLTSPARAFVSLVAAAFWAQAIFFVEPAKLWKVTQMPVSSAAEIGQSRELGA